MPLRRHIIVGVALVALAAGSAQACPKHADHSSTSAALTAPNGPIPASAAAVVAFRPRAWAPPALAAPQSNGLRIAIDPVDGARGMPAADANDLSKQLMIGDNTAVQVDRAPDGTLTAHLDDRWAEFSVATFGPDGKAAWMCTQGKQGAAQFMKHPVIVAPAPVWVEK